MFAYSMVASTAIVDTIAAVPVAAMSFKITELCELGHITLGGSGGETEFRHDLIRCDFLFVAHKRKNIDHFLCQRWLYRPFTLPKMALSTI